MKNRKGTYIIGEIGQNHNGSVDIAKLIIDMINRPVRDELFDLHLNAIDAVKLTKRDLKEELSASAMSMPYDNPNSFGKTYGEHRARLELSDEEHFEIYRYAKENYSVDFIETICAIGAMSILDKFSPDYLKVASRDLTNLPLLDALASVRIPMIISTGMAGKRELDKAIEVISRHHEDISILHCVSQYPTHPNNVNLNSIPYLKENYPRYTIGFSDHTVGISMPLAAVAMGARIIEKHVTIDRNMKGTDQKGSLGPDGVNRMIRDIRLLELSMGKKDIFVAEGIELTRNKLERSIAAKRKIKAGEFIALEDIHMLSPGDGFQWHMKDHVIGRKAAADIPANEIIYPNMLIND